MSSKEEKPKGSGKFLVCPIHGKVEGKEIQMEESVEIIDKNTKEVKLSKKSSRGFACTLDGCNVQRLEKDLD